MIKSHKNTEASEPEKSCRPAIPCENALRRAGFICNGHGKKARRLDLNPRACTGDEIKEAFNQQIEEAGGLMGTSEQGQSPRLTGLCVRERRADKLVVSYLETYLPANVWGAHNVTQMSG